MHRSGFTPRLLDPAQQDELIPLRLGITNLVARASATADELSRDELLAGGRRLEGLTERFRPAYVAVLGVTAYRTAFARPKATLGVQEHELGPALVWVLPNPSGLNAHFTLPALAQRFADLRAAVRTGPPGSRGQQVGQAAPESRVGPPW